jgi:DNA-binding transcriptional LysR family regulator
VSENSDTDFRRNPLSARKAPTSKTGLRRELRIERNLRERQFARGQFRRRVLEPDAAYGDAMMPALIAGTGLGVLPDFLLREALESKRLERVLPDWSIPLGAVYWVTPPDRYPGSVG